MDSTSTTTATGSTQGHIHFVTPTNRWLGSIPLSTLDPLTLEPLSTYVRPDVPQKETKRYPCGTQGNKCNDGQEEQEAEKEVQQQQQNDPLDMKERTTNIAGDPISLILARLQTMPQACACGCTVPDPPKHSDYYHAQHLLRLMFHTQRVRSRSLKAHMPAYFERLLEDSDDGSTDQEDSDNDNDQNQEQSAASPATSDAVIIPIDHTSASTTIQLESYHDSLASSSSSSTKKKQPKKIPRYVHSLVQNRNFRNPLTNTEIEGDPTFFAVLEPGKGGWWHEPWAMTTRPAGVQGFHSLVHRQNTQHHPHQHHQEYGQEPRTEMAKEANDSGNDTTKEVKEGVKENTEEMLQLEKELRKERWRQGRIVNLELEAQHEMDWRRWNRSQAIYMIESEAGIDPHTTENNGVYHEGQKDNERKSRGRKGRRMMRLKLSKDTTLLESSEHGLRLPRRVRIPASTILEDIKSKDVHLQQKRQDLDLEKSPQIEQHHEDTKNIFSGHKDGQYPSAKRAIQRRVTNKCKRRLIKLYRGAGPVTPLATTSTAAVASTSSDTTGFSFLPWWDPDPQPFQMPTTRLSPYAISTLPGPVAELFGGKSIYARPPSPPAPQATTHPASDVHTTNDSSDNASTKDTINIPKNTAGCQWVPVKRGDRIAVMIGTSKDFLLFPSFQRLLFRHLSHEDFEDRVARVNKIPCPATAIVVTASGDYSGGNEASVLQVQQQMVEQGLRMQEAQRQNEIQRIEREQQNTDLDRERATVGSSRRGRSSWFAWMSPRRRAMGVNSNATITAHGVMTTHTTMTAANVGVNDPGLGTPSPHPPSGDGTAFVASSSSSGIRNRSRDPEVSQEQIGRDDSLTKLDEKTNTGDEQEIIAGGTSDTNESEAFDSIDEKAAFDTTRDSNHPISTSIITNTNMSTKLRKVEDKTMLQERWQELEDRFLREDYDSSEYSYASSSEDEDNELSLEYDGPYYSSEESFSDDDYEGVSDDGEGGPRRRQQRSGSGARTTCRWEFRDWIYFFAFCTPHPRTLATSATDISRQARETRRARRRRLRRERRQRIQNRQREQESEVLHRYLPAAIRRRMTAQDVHRCCMAAEFCRFYLTIMMALVLMGAIVYGAVHVEATPPPRPRDIVVQGIARSGGGSLRKLADAEDAGIANSGMKNKQQQPLITIAM
ncbi:hypothetical protein FBU30_007950 [Linnemannia zychae]|nr:hypothetical protein FBU30_007950 [Linnemannia zychae]